MFSRLAVLSSLIQLADESEAASRRTLSSASANGFREANVTPADQIEYRQNRTQQASVKNSLPGLGC